MSLFEYILVTVLLFYVVVGAFMFFMQEQMLFQPKMAESGEPSAARLAGLERITLETPEGLKLAGVVTANAKTNAPLILGLCGNAQNAADFAAHLNSLFPQGNVAVFYYRGYKPSEGSPNETAFFADATRVYDAMKARFTPSSIALVGVSLGTGVASYLATQRAVDHVALVMPYDSIVRVAQYHYPWLPVHVLLTRNRFETIKRIDKVAVPVSVIVVKNDEIVPNSSTNRLIAKIPNLESVTVIENTTHVGLLSLPVYESWLQSKLGNLK